MLLVVEDKINLSATTRNIHIDRFSSYLILFGTMCMLLLMEDKINLSATTRNKHMECFS